MNCCNANGVCDQGKECPIRKQRIQEVNDAYAKGYMMGQEGPLDDVFGAFKDLVAVVIFVACITLLFYVLWGKL